MAFIVISADQASAIAPVAGDVIIIEAGATVTSNADGITGFSVANLNVAIRGTLAGDDNGAEFGAGALVTIGADGSVIGRSSGVWLNGAGSALYNGGTIQSLGDGFSFIKAAVALNNASGALISNTGAIVGRGFGIDYTGSTGTVLDNDGSISALLDAITGTRGISVTNDGSITSGTATAIDLAGSSAGGLKLFNTGTISAPVLAIDASQFVDVIRNKDTIDGNVLLRAGDDRVVNWGDIFGDVDLGDGADRYLAAGDGTVDGIIAGGAGNDTIGGAAGDDLFDGGFNSDILRGWAGDDTLNGGTHGDTLIGGDGDDFLNGGSGFDRYIFKPGFGDDTIVGFSADDLEKIDIRAINSIASFSDLVNNHLTQVGADAVIDDGAGNTITLQNFLVANLSAGDFIF